MSRQGTSSGSREQTAFRLVYEVPGQRLRTRIYWSRKTLMRKLAKLETKQVVSIDTASVRWTRRV